MRKNPSRKAFYITGKYETLSGNIKNRSYERFHS